MGLGYCHKKKQRKLMLWVIKGISLDCSNVPLSLAPLSHTHAPPRKVLTWRLLPPSLSHQKGVVVWKQYNVKWIKSKELHRTTRIQWDPSYRFQIEMRYANHKLQNTQYKIERMKSKLKYTKKQWLYKYIFIEKVQKVVNEIQKGSAMRGLDMLQNITEATPPSSSSSLKS